MSKRKGPGGYPQSDGESSDHETPPPKKPYIPPILSRPAQPTRTFQLPGSASAPPAWSSARSQPKPTTPQPTATSLARQPARAQTTMPTPADTPASRESEARKEWDELDEESPPTSPSVRAVPKTGDGASATPTLKGKEVPSDLQSRGRFVLERKVDVLEKDVSDLKDVLHQFVTASKTRSDLQDTKLNEFVTTSTARFDSQDSKLDRLLQIHEAHAIPVPAEQPQPHEQETRPETINLANPPATHDLRTLVSRVCSSTAIKARSGKDKEVMKDNEVKGFVRRAFFKTLDIAAVKDVRPYYLKPDGSPDFFPSFLMDEKTGYCIPCPQWEINLVDQVAWLPTYLARFRGMIPKDNTDLAVKLRGLSDEEIIILLNDGPFRSCQAAWRALKKGPESLKQAQAVGKQYAWLERKAANRSAYRGEIPSLAGTEHDYLFNKGAMSPEVSDGEGGRVVEQPGWRATWITNFYSAADRAHLAVAKSRPGYQPPRRAHVTVTRPLPDLKAGKTPIRFAICALSSKWRKDNKELVNRSPNINPLLKNPPDIDAFLDKYPIPDDLENDGDDEGERDEDRDVGMVVEESGYGTIEEELGGMGGGEDIEEERGKVGGGEDMALEAGQEGLEEDSIPEADENRRIAIDPSLGAVLALAGEVQAPASASRPRPRPKMKTVTFEEPATSDTPGAAAPIDHPAQSATPTVQTPTLPVDPTAYIDPAADAVRPGPSNAPNEHPTSDSVKPHEWWDPANRFPPMQSPPLLPPATSAPVPGEPTVEPQASTSDQPVKRGRGRPKGSKNKPKENKTA